MAASGSPKPLLRSRGSEGRNSAPSASAINGREIEIEIEQIRARLVANEVERRELEAVLSDLLSRRPGKSAEIRQANPVMDATIVTTASSGAEKIALFRRLFIGRSDVFPVRWENQKTAKSGYAPAARTSGSEEYAANPV